MRVFGAVESPVVTAILALRVPTSRLVAAPGSWRCNLHLKIVAELPQFLCRARVLEENSIDLKRIKFAGTVAIDGVPDTVHKVTELRIVVIRDHQARCPSLRFAGHKSEVTYGLAPRSGMSMRCARLHQKPLHGPGQGDNSLL